ncbi:PhaM family polyhydroxyalkanoate granule multifunctional regulatory protein [Undibacterium sp. Rencai35W]|uniref:PhaM family polyhydroxyalkanoate granule multifunctional regulatory protein n=1 Tax=Undibacterium sp. Rencai35W TaxID=3413046 RepID=UPI003BF0C457
MTSPFQGNDFPGMNAMNDTLSFVKNIWGGMHVPGMVTPTVSIDELDKKIKDLKTVESWLTVNMNMLRGTIQALEVQRATIAALNSLGESFASTMANAGAGKSEEPVKPFEFTKNTLWPNAAASEVKQEPDAEPVHKTFMESVTDPATASVSSAKAMDSKDTEEPAEKAAQAADGNSAFSNPAAWWNLLQDQFKQAVSNAMMGEADAAAVTKSDKSDQSIKKAVLKKATLKKTAATKTVSKKTDGSTVKTSTASVPANKKTVITKVANKETLGPVTKKSVSRQPSAVAKTTVASVKKSTAANK